jgi:hypothetical protein
MAKMSELRKWVDQYKNEEESNRIGQAGAIKAMDYFLEVFGKHGDLSKDDLSSAQKEVERCVEILKAFTGRIAIMTMMQDMNMEED